MATVATPVCRTALGDGIKMALVTSQAEKQFRQLSTTNRRRVAAALSEPVLGNRCRLLTGLGKLRVYHFDVTDTVRVSFRLLRGRACVVHVGTHSKFDGFAEYYTGCLSNTLTPIEESSIMRKHQNNGIPATKAESTVTPPLAPVSAPPEENVAELLARLLIGSRAFGERAKSIDDTIEKLMDDARDAAVRKIEGELANLEGRLAAQGVAFETLQVTFAGARGELAAVGKSVSAHRDAVNSSLEEQRARISSFETQLAGATAKFGRDTTTVAADVHRVETRLDALAEAIAEDCLAPVARRLDQLAEDREQVLGRVGEQDALLAGANNAIAACRGEIATLRGLLSRGSETTDLLKDEVNSLNVSLRDLVVRLAREPHEIEPRTIKARLACFVQVARSVFADLKRFCLTR